MLGKCSHFCEFYLQEPPTDSLGKQLRKTKQNTSGLTLPKEGREINHFEISSEHFVLLIKILPLRETICRILTNLGKRNVLKFETCWPSSIKGESRTCEGHSPGALAHFKTALIIGLCLTTTTPHLSATAPSPPGGGLGEKMALNWPALAH